MFIEPVTTEYVDQQKILSSHFNAFFATYCNLQEEPNAGSETIDGLQRHISGIPSPSLNALVGLPTNPAGMEEHLAYFKQINIPFVWYIDEDSDPSFKAKLVEHGFQDLGLFLGMIGNLDASISIPELPEGYTIAQVETEEQMDQFNELVCTAFAIEGVSKELYKKGLWNMASTNPPLITHWITTKDGRVVSAFSAYIHDQVVSLWNGATHPEFRKLGLFSTMMKVALKDAMSRGCTIGASYLMSDALALGIASQLGAQPKWRFNAFLYTMGE